MRIKIGDMFKAYGSGITKTLVVKEPAGFSALPMYRDENTVRVICSSQHGYLWHSHMGKDQLMCLIKAGGFTPCTTEEIARFDTNKLCPVCGKS